MSFFINSFKEKLQNLRQKSHKQKLTLLITLHLISPIFLIQKLQTNAQKTSV
jgi:hypothetical protein